MEPTGKEIKEFWEWCGCTGNVLAYLVNSSLSLDNLFKWAVPKVGYVILSNWNRKKLPTVSVFDGEGKCSMATDKDSALALFWALYEVLKDS